MPMRRILRRHEVVPAGVVPDEWRLLGEGASDADPLIIPLCELHKDTSAWLARTGRLGVRLTPAESLESLADVLPRLALVAVEFPQVAYQPGAPLEGVKRQRFFA